MGESTPCCDRCGAGVSPEELAGGLAVRVDGQLVCPNCVDNLSGEAQVHINQLRALRGLATTTYSVVLPEHRTPALYSFTTANHIAAHRRSVGAGRPFEAPPLPPPAQRLKLPSREAASRPERRKTLLLVAVANLGLGGLAAVVAALRPEPPAPPAGVASAPLPVAAGKVRFDYPPPALEAWRAASTDPACPAEVLRGIVDEVQQQRQRQLDEAARLIQDGDLPGALRQLDLDPTPDALAFRSLNSREAGLRQAIQQASAAQAPPKAAVVAGEPKPPEAEAPAPQQATPVPPPAKLPTQEPAAAAAPGPSTFSFLPRQFAENPRNTFNGVLPAIGAGEYRLWMRGFHPRGNSSVEVTIRLGEHLRATDARPFKDSTRREVWHALGKPFALTAGDAAIRIEIADGWMIDGLVLIGSDRKPEDASKEAGPVAQVPPPAAAAPAASVLPWNPQFAFPAGIRPLVLDGSTPIPSPWPGGVKDIFAAAAAGRNRFQLSLIVRPSSVAKGGMALLMQRGKPSRKQLKASLSDGQRSSPLPDIIFDNDAWTPVLIPIPEQSADAERLLLVFEDDKGDSLDRPFLLGPACTVSGREPRPADLELAPAPLIAGDPASDLAYLRRMKSLLGSISGMRGSSRAKTFSPFKVKVLCAGLDNDWKAAMRRGLKDWTGQDAVDNQVDELPLGETAFIERQFKTPKPLVEPEWSLVCLVFNARELQSQHSALRNPDKLKTFASGLATALIAGDNGKGRNGGFLPVFVIGGTQHSDTATEDARAIDDAWGKSLEMFGQMGLPVIDLRAAQRKEKGDTIDASAVRLIDGLRQCAYQLQLLLRSR